MNVNVSHNVKDSKALKIQALPGNNVMDSSLAQVSTLRQVLCKLTEEFLYDAAERRTNKPTDERESSSSSYVKQNLHRLQG